MKLEKMFKKIKLNKKKKYIFENKKATKEGRKLTKSQMLKKKKIVFFHFIDIYIKKI